jgi:long-subunit acyl-CoA synthetase (AMP-forming)
VIPDGRLTGEARLSLLSQTDCWHWIGPEDQIQRAHDLNSQRSGIKFHTMPPVEHWLADDSTENYPFNIPFDKVKDDLVLVIHTSGTTGQLLKLFVPLKVLI